MTFLKYAVYAIALILGLLLPAAMAVMGNAQSKDTPKTLTMCIDHYPPLQIIKDDGKVTGENVELTRIFFQRFGYQLQFTGDVPFQRCLQWLKDGRVDVMTGLLDSRERQRDYHMLLYDDLTIKSFFTLKQGPNIEQFSDLEGLNIAVVRGARQFQQFDNAPLGMFQKTYVGTLTAAFGMLHRGRVDAVVCTDYYGENIIKQTPAFSGTIVKSRYEVADGTKVYIGLSRKSRFAPQVESFSQLADEMYQSGEFKTLIRNFQQHHPQYYTDSIN